MSARRAELSSPTIPRCWIGAIRRPCCLVPLRPAVWHRSTFTSGVILYNETSCPRAVSNIPDALDPGKTFYWRIRAVNYLGPCGVSGWTTARSLKTGWLAPVMSSPGDGAFLDNRRPTFEWLAVDGASGYAVQISRYNTFSLILVSGTSNTTSFTPLQTCPQARCYTGGYRPPG